MSRIRPLNIRSKREKDLPSRQQINYSYYVCPKANLWMRPQLSVGTEIQRIDTVVSPTQKDSQMRPTEHTVPTIIITGQS